MDITNQEKVVLIISSGLVGALIGYIIGELIIDRLEFEDFEYIESSEEEEPIKETKNDEKKIDYNKYGSKVKKDELSKLVAPYKTNTSNELPFIISTSEWETQPEYQKETVYWYEEDSSFADVKEEIIDDPASLFVPNVHLHFGENSGDPDIVYVRNDKMGVDYELIRIHGSYATIVMGEPEPVKPKRSRRRKKVIDEGEENEEN